MSFHAGDLVATIRLDGMQMFERDTARAGDSLTKAGAAGSKAGEAIKRGFNVAAVATTALTLAGSSYVATLMRTGAAYNTLQQTSRAALTTMLGGAEAAADQMARLDDFARNSPFSKAVFIQAQQQMLGFGIEASKVVPYLDAIQDAVAATGGNSAQVGEIAQILSKIASQGKITGEELLQLGGRGIDAATMIGESLGMTGEEVRKSITAGTLDSGTALDALAEGMKRTYGGAAAQVKETWSGVLDRISAGQREIGAALAEPFISQQGGGMAVVWGNQVADVLRAILTHVGPVVAILEARAMPGFARLTEALDRARVIIKSWDSSKIETFLNKAEAYGPAIAALAGALVGLTNNGLRQMIPVLGSVIPGFGLLGGTIGALVLGTEEGREALMSLLGAFEPLAPVVADLAAIVAEGLNTALPVAAGAVEALAGAARPLLGLLASIPTPVLAAAAGFLAFQKASALITPMLPALGTALNAVRGHMAASAEVAMLAGGNATTMGVAFKSAGSMAAGLGKSIMGALGGPVGIAILGVSLLAAGLTAAFTAQAQKVAEANARIAEYRDTLDEVTGATTASTRAVIERTLADDDMIDNIERAGLKRETYVRALLGERDAQEQVNRVLADAQSHLRVMNGQQGESLNMYDESNRMLVELAENYNTAGGEIREAGEQQRKANREYAEAEAKTTALARSNDRMATAIGIARDVTAEATSRLNALKQALDELNGGTKTAAELEIQLHEEARNVADAFAQVDENGQALAATLVDDAGKIDVTTAAGGRLWRTVDGLNDAMLEEVIAADKAAKARGESGVSMDEARAIAAKYEEQLRAGASAAGLMDGQIDGMIATMLSTPEVVSFILDDTGSIDANQVRLVELAQQIVDTPDGEFEIHENDIDGLMRALELLGVDITTLPVGRVKVTKDDGSFYHVEGELRRLTETRTAMIKAQIQQSVEVTENRGRAVARAHGGPVFGPGTETSDSIHALLSHNEHVLTAREVRGLGGHAAVAALRQRAREGVRAFADGGPVLRIPEFAAAHVTVPATAGVGASVAGFEAMVDRVADRTADRIVEALYERPPVQITEINPVHRNPMSEAWETAKAGGL